MFDTHRGQEITFVQLKSITFPRINTLEGIFLCSDRPENIARKISVIHRVGKDIAHLVGMLITFTYDGKCIPASVSTLHQTSGQTP